MNEEREKEEEAVEKRELIKDGKRLDGRGFEELRPIKIEVGVLKRADGSCYFELGENKVIAAVYGPKEMHPRHAQDAKMAVVKFRYNMAPFSVDDRKRPGPDRRSVEVSKVSREAFEPVIMREFYPKAAIEVYVGRTRGRGESDERFGLFGRGWQNRRASGLGFEWDRGQPRRGGYADRDGREDEHDYTAPNGRSPDCRGVWAWAETRDGRVPSDLRVAASSVN